MIKSVRRLGKLVLVVGVAGGTAYSVQRYLRQADSPAQFLYETLGRNTALADAAAADLKPVYKKGLPSRIDQIKNLQNTQEYDVLVIGGGATGCGVALDAVTRGLQTAMVELDDFASGTSSRSTKLIHGGVRYLQKAIFNLDYDQYRMVKEALAERANLLDIAPHLSNPLPIMLPVYKWYLVPYYWVGIKAYDLVAGRRNVKSSYFLSKKAALEKFPMLKGNSLAGAIVYYDGQHDDARMCLSIALSAARYGAHVANHVAVTSLLKNEEGKLIGARVKDQLSGKEWSIKAKSVVNATGPFTDSIRQMDDQKQRKICAPSAGVHIMLPGYYSPDSMGLLDPQTSDGRVIFFLPWLNYTIAGTTDKSCEISHHPSPTENDIQFILSEIKHYLSPDVNVRRGDVSSAWSGIRPLVLDPKKPNTESIARNHIIDVSDSGLITIAGGKWTTYREMAEQTVDTVLQYNPQITPIRKCVTTGLKLEGGDNWSPTMYIRLVQDFGIDPQVAKHLSNTYGDKAFPVAKLAELTGKRWPVAGVKLSPEFNYIKAEVRFAVREYAATAVDVIARRMRLAFLNVQAAEEALPKIVDIMAEELTWSKAEKQRNLEEAQAFLNQDMGKDVNRELRLAAPIELSKSEINEYTKQFQSIDRDRKGYIGINDLRRHLKAAGARLTDDDLHAILSEVDINNNGQVELGEYLECMSQLKAGTMTQSRFARAFADARDTRDAIAVDRSGGGV